MATKKQPSSPTKDVGSDSPAKDPLASDEGILWLYAELARAELDERYGPSGAGWAHNEGLRPAIVERAEFLRALIEKLKS